MTAGGWAFLGVFCALFAAVAVWSVLYLRRLSGARGEGTLKKGILTPAAAPPPPTRTALNEEQKRNFSLMWRYLMCGHCGTAHQGSACPRIREIRYHPNAAPERIIFWPEGKWHPPANAITIEDVFGEAAAYTPPVPEGQEAKTP